MGTSITERILGNNKLTTDNYYRDVIDLTKSIVLVNSREATLYNEYVKDTYGVEANQTDKTTWRYYRHLAGQYHDVDVPIQVVSVDNGSTFELTPSSIVLHRLTRRQLLKFGIFYKELVDKYPEQEILIKSIIATSAKKTISEIVGLPDFTVVFYNDDLVEENEDDLIPQLQFRITNYQNIWLIQYYSLSDNLFMASQYHVLYNFIFTSILAIRMQNVKTLRAHSYHILNYLASHHYLDSQYTYLTKRQALFLYRNLLYLDNHSGHDRIFRLLIERLFTERNISVVNYTYFQRNTLTDSAYTDYRFKQRLLNDSSLVYSYKDFSLSEIKDKELSMAPSNPDALEYGIEEIDTMLKNSLFETLLTKDLETIVVDNTDMVKYRLVPTIIDYWAYLLKIGKIRFLVSILDPVLNKNMTLATDDLFKLFTLALHQANGRELDHFPDYTIQRVYQEQPPTVQALTGLFYTDRYYHEDMVTYVRNVAPPITTSITSYQFEQFITGIYRLNIGLWLHTSNIHDKDDSAGMEMVVNALHKTDTYSFDNETPINFLKRIGLEHLSDFSASALDSLLYSILNNIYDGKLVFLNRYKFAQIALIEVFKKFNSYTVQLIDNYSSEAPLLAGRKDTRVTILEAFKLQSYLYNQYNLNVDSQLRVLCNQRIDSDEKVSIGISSNTDVFIDTNPLAGIGFHSKGEIIFHIPTAAVNGLSDSRWVVAESAAEDLKFLAFNM